MLHTGATCHPVLPPPCRHLGNKQMRRMPAYEQNVLRKPYQTVKLTEQDEIMNWLKGMKISELKHEILRLEIEIKELRKRLELPN